MGVRVHVRRKAGLARLAMRPLGKFLLGATVFFGVLGTIVFSYYYVKYARLIEQKLTAGPFQNTSMVFAAPRLVSVGDEITAEEVMAQLRRSGYSESRSNRMGWYQVRPNAVEVFPGPDSYFDQEAAVLNISGGRVTRIVSLRDNTERNQYLLEPELITNLFDRNREKRRLVKFADLPKVLVNAVISAEDKRFFQHAGFDPLRVIKAAYVDLKEWRKDQGASTLTMQLARMFWLDLKKTPSRKAAEVLITLQLEQKLSKEEIFEFYANQIYLGRRGSFAIHGFGEAAQAYFGKDVRQLTLPEAALLAGLIQRPGAYNPYRYPQRVIARRNVVLSLMQENGYISEQQCQAALKVPLNLTPGGMESTDAPYFVDLVNDELQNRFQDHDFQSSSYRVYTTLDLNLQRDAAEAIRIGLKEVDEQLLRRWRKQPGPHPEAQVALLALDPETGAVKALVGGRNYGMSQLNRVLAKRQPGSSFKPFVYAAALTATLEGIRAFTPLTTVVDAPTTFWYDNKPYEPNNFRSQYYGTVTLRQAISKSLNVPTVKIAEAVGYDAVVDLARRAGMNLDIQPTPAVALGAYEVTPLEIAGAYTIYSNHGVFVKPSWIDLIRDDQGQIIYTHKPELRRVLDPRVAYMMVNLLEEVLRSGTGAGVRGRGFVLPAAGKTGTSHDGWFAGFTTKLICVVWVGFDDNRQLGLEGARSALPVWTEFMKRAHQHREFRNAGPFQAPDGIVTVEVDAETGELATTSCPAVRTEVFIAGTQPVIGCQKHGGGTQVASWDVAPERPAVVASNTAAAIPAAARSEPPAATPPKAVPEVPREASKEEKPKQKKGFFGRLLGVFK